MQFIKRLDNGVLYPYDEEHKALLSKGGYTLSDEHGNTGTEKKEAPPEADAAVRMLIVKEAVAAVDREQWTKKTAQSPARPKKDAIEALIGGPVTVDEILAAVLEIEAEAAGKE